ncbi:MAG: flagellar motor protein MotB [Alphaproteobacteria bacterium]|nr:flagellar motor protein MotB [Alphaproteobacteria bacterium]
MDAPEKKDDVDSDSWQGTYGDCVTLLLCFFVMLLAASKPNPAIFEQIRAGIVRDITDSDSVDKPLAQLKTELEKDLQDLKLSDEQDPDNSLVSSDPDGVSLDLPADVFFNSGSATLKPEAFNMLKKFSATLRLQRFTTLNFDVQGHTDNTPIASDMFPSNWELSAARAATVARILIDNGIAPIRMSVTGYADTRPKYPNTEEDEEGNLIPIPYNQQRNRRIVVHAVPTF